MSHSIALDTVLAPEKILKLWKANALLLLLSFMLTIASPYLKSSVLEYPTITPLPFDGTVEPITYVPNWLDAKYASKSLRYENIPVSDFVKTPTYDPQILTNADPLDKIARLTRSTYITPYMGSYRMNFEEYDGSHLGVDIRAPLGTPVVAIANGVVVRTKTTENADGKYVIIRHDGIAYQNTQSASYYSSYLHLESIAITEGTAIKKGDILGYVGMTGITTTPHLHFQIDRDTAAFHPYWPYSFNDLKEAGLDFFEAVNVGFGKENAIKYTVHPMDFVAFFAQGTSSVSSTQTKASITPAEIKVASSMPIPVVQEQKIVPAVPLPQSELRQWTNSLVDASVQVTSLNSAPELPSVVSDTIISTSSMKNTVNQLPVGQYFQDIPKKSPYFESTTSLKEMGVINGYTDGTFHPNDTMTRAEGVMLLVRTLSLTPETSGEALPYADVESDETIAPYLRALLHSWILSGQQYFRPDDTITKQELVILLSRASKLADTTQSTSTALRLFAKRTGYTRVLFRSSASIERWEAANIIYAWKRSTR